MNKSKRYFHRMLPRALCVSLILLLLAALPLTASASTKYIKTTASDVNVRKSASKDADSIGRAVKGAVLKSSGSTTKNDVKWYKVTFNGKTGYIMAKYCKASTESEYKYFSNTHSASASSSSSSSSSGKVDKGTLALTKKTKVIVRAAAASNGKQVVVLRDSGTLCTLQGKTQKADGYTWYSVKASGKTGWVRGDMIRILSSSEAKEYQNKNGSGKSSGGKTLYEPELADWKKDSVNKVFYKGCVATLTDVKTGISFKIKRWSGGQHADVEPLTASDTAKMCKVYGVKTAQEISDRNMYQRRSILITVGGHTYAASMYGIPHNYPEGDTIANNAYNGQFCVHFVNSKVHRTQKVDSAHQKAIQYAYKYGKSSLKQYGYTFK